MFKRFSLKNFLSLHAAFIMLFTTLFPGMPRQNSQPQTLDAAALRRQALLAYYEHIIRPNTDLKAFARLADWTAGEAGQDVAQFMDDMTWLIVGSLNSGIGVVYASAGRLVENLHNRTGLTDGYRILHCFGSSGFQVNDKSNQVMHFWFSVIFSYHLGSALPDALARYHEWNAPGVLDLLPLTGHGNGDLHDLYLSRQAIQLGQDLRDGSMSPDQVSDWLRSNL